MNSVTHVAAPFINFSGRIIQRCAVCGAKLVDSKGAMVPCNPDGSPQYNVAHWEAMALVRVEETGPGVTQSSIVEPGELNEAGMHKAPPDFCIDLVEEV